MAAVVFDPRNANIRGFRARHDEGPKRGCLHEHRNAIDVVKHRLCDTGHTFDWQIELLESLWALLIRSAMQMLEQANETHLCKREHPAVASQGNSERLGLDRDTAVS
jgi:hypothetical protein